MEWPSFLGFEESQERWRMESTVVLAGRIEARELLRDFASRHGLSQAEAATCIRWNRGDLGHQTSIPDTIVLQEVENYAQQELKMVFEQRGLTCEPSHCAPLVQPVVTDGQRAAPDGLLSSLLHRLSSLLHRLATAVAQENRANGRGYVWVSYDDGHREKLYMDRSPHLTRAGHGFSWNMSPRAHDIGGRGSSRMQNWSAEAHPTVRAGRGGSTGPHTFIDIPALLHFLGEEPRETDSENAWASRILETAIGTLLPAAAVNARDFFSAAPDIVELAGNVMLPALLGLCLIGMLHKRRAGRILRLATCAGIAATTLGISSQLSDGIYIFIAAVAGVALSFITLTA